MCNFFVRPSIVIGILVIVGLLIVIILMSGSDNTNTQTCDPSYPDFCIPEHPPDLDCGYIGINDFTVLQPDPHGFDRDKDEIDCETYPIIIGR